MLPSYSQAEAFRLYTRQGSSLKDLHWMVFTEIPTVYCSQHDDFAYYDYDFIARPLTSNDEPHCRRSPQIAFCLTQWIIANEFLRMPEPILDRNNSFQRSSHSKLLRTELDTVLIWTKLAPILYFVKIKKLGVSACEFDPLTKQALLKSSLAGLNLLV